MSDNGGEAHELMEHCPEYYAKNFDLTGVRLFTSCRAA